MQELVKITQNQITGIQTVLASELHVFMESKQQYADWIKKRLEKYQFIEGHDYYLLHNSMKQTGRGGHNKLDYALTLDCAKQLAMVENNEKGRQVRLYFIEVEKKYKERQDQKADMAWNMMQSYAELLKLQGDTINRLDKQMIEIAQAVKFENPLKQFANYDNAPEFQVTRSAEKRKMFKWEKVLIMNTFARTWTYDIDHFYSTAEITKILNEASSYKFDLSEEVVGRCLAHLVFMRGEVKGKFGWFAIRKTKSN